jgi:uncharacterized membrane protein required for colicin V production
MFNAFDFLLIFFIILGAAWGVIQGAGRLLIGFFSLYVGLVVSLLLYRPIANWFRDLLPAMSLEGSQSLAFILLLLVFVNGISLLIRLLGTPPEERRRARRGQVEEALAHGSRRFITGPLNQLVGLLVGLLVTVVWISLLLAILQYALRAGIPGLGGALRTQIGASQLVPWFNVVLAQVYWSVSFWVPGEMPGIFANLLG